MSFNIMVVDDEQAIANLVELYLQNDGYTVQKFYSAAPALLYAQNAQIDLALLDVMLPDMDGFSLCKALRKTCLSPVLMLTAKISEDDKIMGLTVGADDYITKPFSPLELMARVKAQLRRANKYSGNCENQNDIIDIRGLTLDKTAHTCTLDDKEINLTPTEFSILLLLCENCGKVISSEQLFESVWGEKFFDSNNTVMVHIRRLRGKLGEPMRNPRFVKTVWGVGYKVEE